MLIENARCNVDISGRFDQETCRESRFSAMLAYLIFFIPLVIHPDSKFGRYHANQALILTLLMTIGVTVLLMVPYAGLMLGMITWGFGIIFAIRGMILALICKAKCVPLIGRLILIEYEQRL